MATRSMRQKPSDRPAAADVLPVTLQRPLLWLCPVSALLLATITTATAGFNEDWDACRRASGDAGIAACTDAINARKLSPADLAAA